MNQKINVMVGSLVTFFSMQSFATDVVQKEHEQWWEKNVLEKIGTFADWLGDINADSRVKMRAYIQS